MVKFMTFTITTLLFCLHLLLVRLGQLWSKALPYGVMLESALFTLSQIASLPFQPFWRGTCLKDKDLESRGRAHPLPHTLHLEPSCMSGEMSRDVYTLMKGFTLLFVYVILFFFFKLIVILPSHHVSICC